MPLGIDSRNYSTNPEDYKLLQEVGYGASATVHRAIYLPLNEVIAIKCLDLDRCNANLDDIRREAQTMSLIDHPNVIKAYCSFVVEHSLWVVMPFMAEGSCLHLMKVAYPNGIDEAAICSVLKETLKALDYLHRHGHIHRDVKAGNILLDKNGVVKLGDFGVSACMFDKGDRQRSRNTFVGTPCWMAPEVLQPGSGYDFKADIWSFGITALELAHGHAPFSRYPPMKVLLMTIQSAPPGLDSERDKRFSKSFKEMVAMCLVKDQTKRPTAEKLLKHSFFKHAKPPEMTVADLLKDLPPLWDRVKTLQLKDAAQLALKKMPSAEQEAISQSEYKRGVSAWNFDIEDLKAQASLVQDDESLAKDEEDMIREFVGEKDADGLVNSLGTSVSTNETYSSGALSCSQSTEIAKKEHSGIDMHVVENKDKDNGCDKEIVNNLPVPLASKEGLVPNFPKLAGKTRQIQSGPLVPSVVLTHSLSDRGLTSERSDSDHQSSSDKLKREGRKGPNLSGPIMLPTRASSNSLSAPIRSSGGISSFEDKSKTNNVVQIKGRFSVTSENVDLVKGSPLKKSASVGNWLIDSKQVPANQSTKEIANNGVPVSAFVPYLQNLFQQTSFQQDLIMNLLTTLQYAEITEAPQNGKLTPQTSTSENDTTTEVTTIERERLLLSKISELQTRIANMTDELTAAKLKHVQLQQQLCAALSREEEEEDRLARGREET